MFHGSTLCIQLLDSVPPENAQEYQQIGRDEAFPAALRTYHLALASLPPTERQRVATEANIMLFAATRPSLSAPANGTFLGSQIEEQQDLVKAGCQGNTETYCRYTNDGVYPILPANADVGPTQSQTFDTTSYPTPVSVHTFTPNISNSTINCMPHTPSRTVDESGYTTPATESPSRVSEVPVQSSASLSGEMTHQTNQSDGLARCPEVVEHLPSRPVHDDPLHMMASAHPDLSRNQLQEILELRDRIFPRDLIDLEAQINHLQAEGLWGLSEVLVSPTSSFRQKIAEVFQYLKVVGKPNTENYMRIRFAKVQVNYLLNAVREEEKMVALNLSRKKFESHVLNCVEAAIRCTGDQSLPPPKESLVRDAIFRYQRVGAKWWVSSQIGLGMILLVDHACGQDIENNRFTQRQMEALVSYVYATRPDAVALCNGLHGAVMDFLLYNQLPPHPNLAEIRTMISDSKAACLWQQ